MRYALVKACGRIWAKFPLVAGKFLQKPASKSLLEMLKNTTKVRENFLLLHRKFSHKNLQEKYDIMTYLRVLVC
jgi:hypothetical protein